MNKLIKNKKGIGFGKLFLVLCIVLFGLTLWLFTRADKKVNNAVGTEELDKISNANLKFYFLDSMRLADSEFIKKSADYSFIDIDNTNCQLTNDRLIILNSDCKPDKETLKMKAVDEIKQSINNSLKEMNVENDVSCLFEGSEINFFRCYSNEITLSSERNSDFFNYVIYNKFSLNQTINFDEQLNLTELDEIYFAAKNCQDVNCNLNSQIWDVEKIERNGDYLIFSLKTKKEYPFEDKIEKISWKFAIKL